MLEKWFLVDRDNYGLNVLSKFFLTFDLLSCIFGTNRGTGLRFGSIVHHYGDCSVNPAYGQSLGPP